MNIIDPHIHLFDIQLGQYDWLKPNNPPLWSDKALINRNFSQQDLILNTPFTISHFVHIEAGFNNDNPASEIAWLERSCSLPFKSIAYIDLTWPQKTFQQHITQLLTYRSVVGVRHILDDDIKQVLTHPNTAQNLALLEQKELIFELQFNVNDSEHVDICIKTFEQHPRLKLTLEHAGFVMTTSDKSGASDVILHANQKAMTQLTRLSQLPLIAVKCSGWEMTDRHYTFADVAHTVNICIDTFGVNKVMLASNFPLCQFSVSYEEYWDKLLAEYLSNSDPSKSDASNSESSDVQPVVAALCFHNAANWYGFSAI